MELMEVISGRRSIRAFEKNGGPDREQLNKMISAAQLAPSWKNSQTARYYVIEQGELLEKVKKECLPEFNSNSSENAPVLIVACFVKNRSGFTREGVAENEIGNGWGCYDAGLQNQNLILEAYELGFATLIMGIRDADKLRMMLNIPEEQEIISVIAVGKAAIHPDMPNRKAVEDIAVFMK